MDKFVYQPIGVIRSPFKNLEGMPIQPPGAAGVFGTVEIDPQYESGLKDLDGFSHIVLIYHFHGSAGFSLQLVPFLDDEPRGVFATRAPRRPNAIGLSVVRLKKTKGNILEIENVDVLDGTPLLDIKPFVPDFDVFQNIRTGWLEKASKKAGERKSDKRFMS